MLFLPIIVVTIYWLAVPKKINLEVRGVVHGGGQQVVPAEGGERAAPAHLVERGLAAHRRPRALQLVNRCDIGRDNCPLVKHHARGKKAKQDCLKNHHDY
uniref:Uncharacterized protein n=1 Tax=Heterosigma akashiwo TaxID=2829 RepID=A0A6S9GRK4_HETAK